MNPGFNRDFVSGIYMKEIETLMGILNNGFQWYLE